MPRAARLLALVSSTILSSCIDFVAAKDAFCEGNASAACAAAASCTNAIQDGSETDVDCGGSCSAKCALDATCATAADCESGQCNAVLLVCSTGPCADGIKNNQETDIDCGGGGSCAKCSTSKTCLLASDCATDHCDTSSRCALYALEWNFAPQRLCPRRHPVTATLGERLYVGGVLGSAPPCDASVIDPPSLVEGLSGNANTWTAETTLTLVAGEGGAMLSAGPNLYLVGGFNDSQTIASAIVKGTNGTANFKTLNPMAAGRAYFASAVLPDGRLFVAGGHPTDITLDVAAHASTELFTPDPTLATNGTWAAGPPLGIYRAGASAAATPDGRVFVMGGVLRLASSPEIDAIEVFPAGGGTPTATTGMPIARAYFGMAYAPDGRIYIAGGRTSAGATDRVDAYDPATGVWTQLTSLPATRSHLALVVGPNNRLYAIAGRNTDLSTERTVFLYGPSLALTTASVAAGATALVTGSYYPATTPFTLRWDAPTGPVLASGITIASGNLPPMFSFTVPADATAGAHAIYVTDAKSQYPVRATLTVP